MARDTCGRVGAGNEMIDRWGSATGEFGLAPCQGGSSHAAPVPQTVAVPVRDVTHALLYAARTATYRDMERSLSWETAA